MWRVKAGSIVVAICPYSLSTTSRKWKCLQALWLANKTDSNRSILSTYMHHKLSPHSRHKSLAVLCASGVVNWGGGWFWPRKWNIIQGDHLFTAQSKKDPITRRSNERERLVILKVFPRLLFPLINNQYYILLALAFHFKVK